MPKPYQRTVTLNKTIYQKAKKKADTEDKSVSAFVTELILDKCKAQED